MLPEEADSASPRNGFKRFPGGKGFLTPSRPRFEPGSWE